MQTMLRTTRFGDIAIDDARVFHFADGLPGFPGARSFLAMNVDENPNLYWLQCVDDGSLAFLAVTILLPLATGTAISIFRIAASAAPLYVALALLGRGRMVRLALLAFGGALGVAGTVRFSLWYWAG